MITSAKITKNYWGIFHGNSPVLGNFMSIGEALDIVEKNFDIAGFPLGLKIALCSWIPSRKLCSGLLFTGIKKP